MNEYKKSDWEKIPIWDKDSPEDNFIQMKDQFNGRIPVTRLEHWRDFTPFLETEFCNRKSIDLVFRGHRRYDWGLTPNLARFNEKNVVTNELANMQLIGAADYSNALIEEWEQNRKDKKTILLQPEPIIITPPSIHAEIVVSSPTIESQDITSIVKVLHGALSQDEVVEKDSLDKIAYEIAKTLTDYKEVDFEERGDLALELKAKLKIILRKLEYPENNRESAAYNIFDFVVNGGV